MPSAGTVNITNPGNQNKSYYCFILIHNVQSVELIIYLLIIE